MLMNAQDKKQHAAELAQQQEMAAAREAAAHGEAAAAEQALRTELEALNAQLASVADFRAHQASVEAEVLALKEENQGLREQLELQRLDLER